MSKLAINAEQIVAPTPWAGELYDDNVNTGPPADVLDDAGEVIPERFEVWRASLLVDRHAEQGHDTEAMRHGWQVRHELPAATVDVMRRVLAGPGSGAILYGPPGRGKSHTAGRVTLALRAKGVPVRWVEAALMIEQLRIAARADSETALTNFRNQLFGVETLVIDDLGVENLTDFAAKELDLLINARWNNRENLRTIVTTNYAGAELQERVGERTTSRLLQICEPVMFDGSTDWRLAR